MHKSKELEEILFKIFDSMKEGIFDILGIFETLETILQGTKVVSKQDSPGTPFSTFTSSFTLTDTFQKILEKKNFGSSNLSSFKEKK